MMTLGQHELVMYGLVMGSGSLAAAVCFPAIFRMWMRLADRVEGYHQSKVQQASRALDESFLEVKPTPLKVAYGLGPVAGAALAFVLSKSLVLAGVGLGLGWLLPDLWVRRARAIRRRRFQAQLVDALFILSSSLKAGLSLTQAFEALESELPPPASQEFGLMVKAHRLGRSFEEALQSLTERMPSEALSLMTTAILVARETGGDITTVIEQLITTIREKRKLSEKVTTLTLQGRLQAYIMSLLPVLFAMLVRTFNPRYFDPLFHDPTGNALLVLAVGLWVVGMVLLFRFGRVSV